MKKIIIMFMAISMLLVSCSTPNTPSYDDVIPTSTDSGSNNGNNGGNGSTPSNPTNPITQYTVTFNSNGGSSVNSQIVAPNGHATKPNPNPTKVDCEFAYWYSTNENVEYDFATATITDNITLYAKWYMHYFELESGKTVYNYDYKVIYNNSPVNSNFRETRLDVTLLEGTIILDVSNNDNKIKFTSRDEHKSVQNVTVDRTTNSQPTVTIKLVDNN